MLDTIVRFFQEGGPFMYPIAIVLALGLAITLERFFYLSAVRRRNRIAFERGILPLLRKRASEGYSLPCTMAGRPWTRLWHKRKRCVGRQAAR